MLTQQFCSYQRIEITETFILLFCDYKSDSISENVYRLKSEEINLICRQIVKRNFGILFH